MWLRAAGQEVKLVRSHETKATTWKALTEVSVEGLVPEHAAKPSGNQLGFQQLLDRALCLAVPGRASHGKVKQVILNALGI